MEEKVVNRMPWWGISLMAHVLMFLILTTIVAFRTKDVKQEIIIAKLNQRQEIPITEDPPEKPTPAPATVESNEDKPGDLDTKSNDEDNVDPDEFNLKKVGENEENLTDDPFNSKNRINAIGSGDTGPGRKGTRRGGPDAFRKRGKGAPRWIDVALTEALRWLARHQNADGSWYTTKFTNCCSMYGYKGRCAPNDYAGDGKFDTGNTSLALLAFLGAGYTHASKKKVFDDNALTYGDVVRRACQFLISQQDISGRIGPEVDKYMYNHSIASLALVEAYGMTGLGLLQRPAQKAIDFLLKAKNPGFGWRYRAQSGDTDSSVTGWAIMALKSAELAEITFDRTAYQDVLKWYADSTKEVEVDRIDQKPPTAGATSAGTLSLTGYKGSSDAGKLVAIRGINDHYYYNPVLTAIMMMSSIFIEKHKTPNSAKGMESLMAFMPQKWSPTERSSWRVADFYYWYYATYALFQVTSESDETWKRWNKALQTALLDTQNLRGFDGQCKRGSWEPVDRWSCEGGRVYATAMGALTLEVYFRYTKVLQEKK